MKIFSPFFLAQQGDSVAIFACETETAKIVNCDTTLQDIVLKSQDPSSATGTLPGMLWGHASTSQSPKQASLPRRSHEHGNGILATIAVGDAKTTARTANFVFFAAVNMPRVTILPERTRSRRGHRQCATCHAAVKAFVRNHYVAARSTQSTPSDHVSSAVTRGHRRST